MKRVIAIIIFTSALCGYILFNDKKPGEIDIRPVIRSYSKNNHIGKVGYQIIIDRRRNGNTGNDIPFLPIRQYASLITGEITQRGSDRYSFSKLEKNYIDNQNFDTGWKQRHFESDLLWSRTYGGDFDGIIEKIPYLKDLSVDFIYINSPFESNSAMGYDTVDLGNINKRYILKDINTIRSNKYNNIGSSVISDANLSFIHLTNTLHNHNIKVIVDVSFFYTALQSKFYNDILEHGIESKYRSWFDVFTGTDNSNIDMKNSEYCKSSDIVSPGSRVHEIFYLPRRKFCETGPRIKIINNSYHSGYTEYIISSLNNRINDNDAVYFSGIDGLRIDVFPELPVLFLEDLRDQYKEKVQFIAEDWGDSLYEDKKKQTYDTITNYEFRSLIEHIFFNRDGFEQLEHSIGFIYRMLGKNNIDTIMQYWNILGSHDTSRIRSQLLTNNRSKLALTLKWDLSNKTRLQDGGIMDNQKPYHRNYIPVIQSILGLQGIFPGSSIIYYGDEVGMRGPDDPSNRQPMLWDDIDYEKQSLCVANTDHYCNPETLQKKIELKPDTEILELYKKITSFKSQFNSFTNGDFHIGKGGNNLIVHRRSPENESWYIYNFSDKDSNINLPLTFTGEYKEIRSNKTIYNKKAQKKSFSIPGNESLLIFN